VTTANSRAVAEDVAQRDRLPIEEVVVVYNGIDLSEVPDALSRRTAVRRELGLTASEKAIVCVANLIEYKGHHDLLTAFSALLRERPECRLFLVGADRGIGEALRRQTISTGMHERVRFMGERTDVMPLLGAMDLAVLASHEEGLSNALLEYLAVGLPVVATNVGGNAEVLAGLPGCRLVPARNGDVFARAMLEALQDIGNEDSARSRTRHVTTRFSVDAMVAAHLEIYGFAS
jgi:glycosyltransferase involved in cell wall biosynthesis